MSRIFAAILTLALAVPAFAADDTEKVERTVTFPSGGTLKLKNFSGLVTVTGADRSDVAINAIRRAPRERLDRIKLTIETTANGVLIEANKRDRDDRDDSDGKNNNVVETEFDIQVPRAANLDLTAFSSPIRVDGVGGAIDVQTFSGEIRLNGVSRRLKAKTFSASIEATLSDRQSGDLDADTFSGDIRIRLPKAAPANVSFNSFSGDIECEYPLLLQSKSRRSLRAQLAPSGAQTEARADMRFKTFSGDVRITK
jgi:DUF4097 and DUF4098 domain-containing protein YvlB